MIFHITIAASLILFLPQRAGAWADGGHKSVALIAYERLGEAERAWTVSILEKHPLWQTHFAEPMLEEIGASPDKASRTRWLFAQAAVWPDKVRPPKGSKTSENPLKQYHHATWHYTDMPVFIDDNARVQLAKHDKPPFTNWWPKMYEPKAGWDSVQILKKAMHDLSDSTTSDADRALMLCWLFHLAGDMHQPCHCASLYSPGNLPNGDRGGNSLTLTGMSGKTLHAYWDELLNEHGLDLKGASQTAQSLLDNKTLIKKAEAAPHTRDPEEWLKEGWSAAKAHVYTAPLLAALKNAKLQPFEQDGKTYQMVAFHLSGSDFTTYKAEAKATADQQVVIAGVRLADVMKSIIAK